MALSLSGNLFSVEEGINRKSSAPCSKGQVLFNFMVPKKDGGFRPILDLRLLKTILKTLPFGCYVQPMFFVLS